MSGVNKRSREEEEGFVPAGAGAGRGVGRPPGAPPPSLQETLASIQAQLSLQTSKMDKLAQKEDVQDIANKVEGLAMSVKQNADDIVSVKTTQDQDRETFNERIAALEKKVQDLSDGRGGSSLSSSSFCRTSFQDERYMICRRSLRFWPVPVMYSSEDPVERITQDRAACCVFMRDFLKVDSPEDLVIEEISFPRIVTRSSIRNEMLVRFSSVADRDEVISHAVNLKGIGQPAGVRLDIPDHLQSDFKTLIQYGNDARDHYGKDVKRSVRFFEEEQGLILHLGLPSGRWVKVTPTKAREIRKFRRQRLVSSMRKALSDHLSSDHEESMSSEAGLKAFTLSEIPLTGANSVPITSTPTRTAARSQGEEPLDERDEQMNTNF